MIHPTLFLAALLIEGGIFAAWIWWRQRINDARERELLDRLMARSLTEYTISQARQAHLPPAGGAKRHNVIHNHQARERGEAAKATGRPANPLLSDNDD